MDKWMTGVFLFETKLQWRLLGFVYEEIRTYADWWGSRERMSIAVEHYGCSPKSYDFMH